ncbi:MULTISPECIES: peptide MFS transporter [Thiorhodovibrio]|uniref:peptide MFS transporter n=1 Tax=Thiorhodovibrio TaxID=61593 RepID=UPI00191374DC|nr:MULTISPECIES: oligopeptide:H+ symporter [Thiorhodovibrio]MBK5968302.1 MFS transporter [Thiorhodovibrio winogradskyi]WPL12334.1 Di-/tripeptide transporter [Thiorhodovibrio litoralis]
MTDLQPPSPTPAERSLAAGDNRRFLGHPSGLAMLFNVELWERFSYYGMRAILAYYLYATIAEGGLGLHEATAAVVVATYGASVYLLSVVGGFLADRLLGARSTTLYGGMVIMAGHLCMAVPGIPAFSWSGLALIALGSGLLKPNISTMVGALYAPSDPRRDGGFQLFYLAINLGALLAPFVVAFLKQRWGFHAGFAAAAAGMAVALSVYIGFTRTLHGAGDAVPNPLSPDARRRLPWQVVGLLGGIGLLYLLTGVLRGWEASAQPARVNDAVFALALLASAVYFRAMLRHPRSSASDRRHVRAYLPLFIGACLFWMVFEQAAGYMALFAEANTELSVGAFRIDPEWYQTVNPISIVILAPLFGWLFTRRAGRFPSTPFKFASAVLLIGLSAAIMSWLFATYPADGPVKAAFWMLAGVFVLQTVAELMLSPVGLSATTTLAPAHFASQVMSLWFLTSAVGQGLAGQIIQLTHGRSPAESYLINAVLTLGIALVLFALVPWTRRQMQDIEEARRLAVRG